MIHLSDARKVINQRKPINIKFWKKNGEIVTANNVVCTSSFFKNDTINFKFLNSEEIRKIRIFSIFELNGDEVCL